MQNKFLISMTAFLLAFSVGAQAKNCSIFIDQPCNVKGATEINTVFGEPITNSNLESIVCTFKATKPSKIKSSELNPAFVGEGSICDDSSCLVDVDSPLTIKLLSKAPASRVIYEKRFPVINFTADNNDVVTECQINLGNTQ